MKLTPAEILKYLGFDVPEEGVEINPEDAFLCSKALELVGDTLNVESISDDSLRALHSGMTFLVKAGTGFEARQPDAESLLKLRTTLTVLLKQTFKATQIR